MEKFIAFAGAVAGVRALPASDCCRRRFDRPFLRSAFCKTDVPEPIRVGSGTQYVEKGNAHCLYRSFSNCGLRKAPAIRQKRLKFRFFQPSGAVRAVPWRSEWRRTDLFVIPPIETAGCPRGRTRTQSSCMPRAAGWTSTLRMAWAIVQPERWFQSRDPAKSRPRAADGNRW